MVLGLLWTLEWGRDLYYRGDILRSGFRGELVLSIITLLKGRMVHRGFSTPDRRVDGEGL